MKKLVATVVLILGGSFFSQALAASGDYVCEPGGDTAKTVQDVLNKLKCDNSKPFSVSIAYNGYVIVCCVEQ